MLLGFDHGHFDLAAHFVAGLVILCVVLGHLGVGLVQNDL